MLIKNCEEAIPKEKLFFCKSPNLMKFLTKMNKIHYVKKELQENVEGQKFIWVYLKTPILDKALSEWSNNKKNGTFVFKPNKTQD